MHRDHRFAGSSNDNPVQIPCQLPKLNRPHSDETRTCGQQQRGILVQVPSWPVPQNGRHPQVRRDGCDSRHSSMFTVRGVVLLCCVEGDGVV